MSADTGPGLSTGPLLPGDSGWFWDLWLKGVLSGCQDFTGGGVVRREGRREGEQGRWALDFLKRPRKIMVSVSLGIQRGVFKDMRVFVPRGMSFMVN